MPLPKNELKLGVNRINFRGTIFTEIPKLLKELHEGVLELGVGKCEIRSSDDMSNTADVPMIGFRLGASYDIPNRYTFWNFSIPTSAVICTSRGLAQGVRDALTTTQGRGKLMVLLEQGVPPSGLEKGLLEPPVSRLN
jgi:hypothetical protein